MAGCHVSGMEALLAHEEQRPPAVDGHDSGLCTDRRVDADRRHAHVGLGKRVGFEPEKATPTFYVHDLFQPAFSSGGPFQH